MGSPEDDAEALARVVARIRDYLDANRDAADTSDGVAT